MDNPEFRCGYAAIVGRPNVGKSTLLNYLLGSKLSITSRRPQTTRHRMLGIKTTPEYQVIYVDTPGIHRGPTRVLNRYMNREATRALLDVEAVVFLIEALRWTTGDAEICAHLRDLSVPVVLAINKVDRAIPRQSLLPFLQRVSQEMKFDEIVPVVARRGENTDRLEALIVQRLPKSGPLFPADQVTDRSERFLVSELIREKLTRKLAQELPYQLDVHIEQYMEATGLLNISAVVWVEQESQKAIVIGHKGHVLKSVGYEARQEIERLVDRRVFLRLWVKVKEGWSNSESDLKTLGYGH